MLAFNQKHLLKETYAVSVQKLFNTVDRKTNK